MLQALYARGGVADEVDDAALIRALCDVEAALARVHAARGEIAAEATAAIAAACADPDVVTEAVLADSLAAHATPVVGLVAALRARVGPDVADAVHLGATSQDIVDTALMLVAHRALVPLLADLDGAAAAAARLAAAHRDAAMVGRTLLQQALPTTFGLLAAGWLQGLLEARVHLVHVRDAELAVQLGGPVGGADPALADALAAELGLVAPALGWATVRVRPALTASVLSVCAGVVSTVARDVTLLSQTEIGELAEGRPGGSSAMAHKRNPVAAVSALACARRVPGLAGTMLTAMEGELQRAAGAWQAEWGTLTELVALTGSALAWLRDCLEGLRVDVDRMAANLAGSAVADRPLPDGAGALVDRALAAWSETCS